MEPSRERDGDVERGEGVEIDREALQWSRRANATETWAGDESQPHHVNASMEPSRERDGDEPGLGLPIRAQIPLQWSRRANATETDRVGRAPSRIRRFNGAVARTRRRPCAWARGTHGRAGFNGAVARTRRRQPGLGLPIRAQIPLQWSRRANATETVRAGSEQVIIFTLQWSRRANATETRPCPGCY